MNRAGLEAEVRRALDGHEDDRDAQVQAVTTILARVIEQTCHTPRSQRGPGRDEGWQPVQPRKQRQDRRSA